MFDLYDGDCLEIMPRLGAMSVDLILCDLPYGTTAAKWDSVLDLGLLWQQYERLLRPSGCVVLTASQPFTAILTCSKLDWFRYEWIWEKSKASNFLLAKKQPLKAHESVLVFSKGTAKYNPQKVSGKPFKGAGRSKKGSQTDLVNNVPNPTFRNDNNGDRFPRSVQYFVTAESEGCYHPTQKPLDLMSYLISTHSDHGDTVLDNCMGSGTTIIAAAKLNRHAIGIEKDPEIFSRAVGRIAEETRLP